MQYYAIEYTETRTATFNVQADSYEDACERFANMLNNDDIIYNVLDNTDFVDTDTNCLGSIGDEPDDCCDDTITDDDYKMAIGIKED